MKNRSQAKSVQPTELVTPARAKSPGDLINFWQALAAVRSSRRRCSVRKGVLRNFAKFTGKHLSQSLFFNKFAS